MRPTRTRFWWVPTMAIRGQRAILNFTPAPQGWISPLGVNLAPRGEHSLFFRRIEGRTENFTPGGQLRPWGSKFVSRGKVKNGPLLLRHEFVPRGELSPLELNIHPFRPPQGFFRRTEGWTNCIHTLGRGQLLPWRPTLPLWPNVALHRSESPVHKTKLCLQTY
jgi:hypothetical protein